MQQATEAVVQHRQQCSSAAQATQRCSGAATVIEHVHPERVEASHYYVDTQIELLSINQVRFPQVPLYHQFAPLWDVVETHLQRQRALSEGSRGVVILTARRIPLPHDEPGGLMMNTAFLPCSSQSLASSGRSFGNK